MINHSPILAPRTPSSRLRATTICFPSKGERFFLAPLLSRRALFSTQASAAPEAPDLSGALAKFRATIPSHFDREYVENAVVPFFLGSIFAGERPILPMIDLPLTKQDAIPWDFWGMLYEDWKPNSFRTG